ncbi:SPRY domain-containing SOCS box 3 [Brachionus plicatilis]|uniref:SPRY domain-containing SOCS box 3 n=1 Tax=Brachionus plicatilis TaxID=10195 RepID=A0A3M7T1C7_BRAPC|nr:SPRY domain-containing SOCS box 3 [Brachionus plicatilis]
MLLAALNRPLDHLKQIPVVHLNCKKESSDQVRMALDEFSSKHETSVSVPLKNYHVLNWNWLKSESDKQMYSADLKTVCLHPFCAGCFKTDGVRVQQALKRNAFTYWQVEISKEALSGTSTMIGIGKAHKSLSSIGYLNLIGSDEISWGLSTRGLLWHNNNWVKYTEAIGDSAPVKIGCLFDGFSGRLSFFVNGAYMGLAFDNICMDEPIFAMITSTVSKSLFKLLHVFESFPSLQDICKSNINKNSAFFQSDDLPSHLAQFLRNY